MSTRLAREVALLYKAEAAYGIPAGPVIDQLVQFDRLTLPDVIPPRPAWSRFKWPSTGVVNWEAYWREVDSGRVVPLVVDPSGPF